MSFDFDDNLKTHKRKNTNPARLTNFILVLGFVAMGLLIISVMNTKSPHDNDLITQSDIEATVDARVASTLAIRSTPVAEQLPNEYDLHAPTLEPRPLVEGQHLVGNQAASGTLTDAEYAIDYTFDGQAGTPIVLTMRGHTLSSPALVVTHPNGSRMASSLTLDQDIGTDSIQVIAAILPTDGQYIVTATRKGGRAGNSTGDFILTLDIPKSLSITSTITSTSSANTWDWYVFEGSEPFTVVYQHASGDYQPEVGVYTLNAEMELVNRGYLPEGQLSYGAIGYFAADVLHFIAVGQPTQGDSTELDATASYKIMARLAQ